MMRDDSRLDATSVWTIPSFAKEINDRYLLCLTNDITNPERGESNAVQFKSALGTARYEAEIGRAEYPTDHSCQTLAERTIVPYENSYWHAVALDTPTPDHPALLMSSRRTGVNAQARREARRAALRLGPYAEHEAIEE